jgi:hypothetical protein
MSAPPAKSERVMHASFPKLAAGERVKFEIQIGAEKLYSPIFTP